MKSVFGERRLDGGNPSKHESLPLLQTLKAFWRILIPFWIKFLSKKQAEKDVCELLEKAPYTFQQLYERAWKEYAEFLP